MAVFIPILRALNETGSRYVIVGGLATVLQGYVRFTADLDLVVDLDPTQALRVIDALTARGYRPRAPVAAEPFADPRERRRWIEEKHMQVFSLWKPDSPLESVALFVESPIDFESLWARSEQMRIGTISVRVASIPDLITMKVRAGRDQDLLDIAQLRAILQSRDPSQPDE